VRVIVVGCAVNLDEFNVRADGAGGELVDGGDEDVGCTRRVVGDAGRGKTDVAGDPRQKEIVPHPVGGGVGVGTVGDARGAAGSEGQPVEGHVEDRHAVRQVGGAADVDGHRVHDLGPGGDVEYAVVVRVQVGAQGAGEIFHQQQGQGAVLQGIGCERGQPEAVGVGGAHGDHLVHRPGGRAGIAFDLQDGQVRVVGAGGAVELDVLHVRAGGGGRELVDHGFHASRDVAAQAVEGVRGVADPLRAGDESVAAIGVAGAYQRHATQGVVGGGGEPGTPLATRVGADLADHVHDGARRAAFAQDHGVVAVEPAGAVGLVGLGEDGRVGGAVGDDVHIAVGHRARQGDGQPG